MRDYEFRGKRLDNGEWVYGSLTVRLVDGYLDHSKKRYYIQYDYMNNYGQVFTDKFEVDPSTIGQFTGLVDKNGKRIYEGDVIKLEDRYVFVTYDEYLCAYDLEFLKYRNQADIIFVFKGIKMLDLFKYEVIGNIATFTLRRINND